MNTALAVPADAVTSLPALVDRAVSTLVNARTAAEVLDARDLASVAYDAAKKAARLAKAKQAADELIKAAYRAQADALDIEGQAKRRLADEYDAAQERGEVAKPADSLKRGPVIPNENNGKARTTDIGISAKEIHEGRMIRDAEETDPGIVRRTVDEAVAAGEEPTKAKVRRAVAKAAKKKGGRCKVRYSRAPASIDPEPRHDADLRRLEVAWEAACQSARAAFLQNLGYSNEQAA